MAHELRNQSVTPHRNLSYILSHYSYSLYHTFSNHIITIISFLLLPISHPSFIHSKYTLPQTLLRISWYSWLFYIIHFIPILFFSSLFITFRTCTLHFLAPNVSLNLNDTPDPSASLNLNDTPDPISAATISTAKISAAQVLHWQHFRKGYNNHTKNQSMMNAQGAAMQQTFQAVQQAQQAQHS